MRRETKVSWVPVCVRGFHVFACVPDAFTPPASISHTSLVRHNQLSPWTRCWRALWVVCTVSFLGQVATQLGTPLPAAGRTAIPQGSKRPGVSDNSLNSGTPSPARPAPSSVFTPSSARLPSLPDSSMKRESHGGGGVPGPSTAVQAHTSAPARPRPAAPPVRWRTWGRVSSLVDPRPL